MSIIDSLGRPIRPNMGLESRRRLARVDGRFGLLWWTPRRDEKLRYVMETYGDLNKAARVLGCAPRNAQWRWDILTGVIPHVLVSPELVNQNATS